MLKQAGMLALAAAAMGGGYVVFTKAYDNQGYAKTEKPAAPVIDWVAAGPGRIEY